MKENRLKNMSEYEGARLLAGYGIPTVKSALAHDWSGVKRAGEAIGYPVVLKLTSPEISHKTERGFVQVDLRGEVELERAFHRMVANDSDGSREYLVQEMVRGERELVMGMIRDPQFGPCVMFGLGGIFAEVFGDVVFRKAPLSKRDAAEMLDDIKSQKILGPVRGMPAVNRDSLIACLIAVGRIGVERDDIVAVDINPLIVRGSEPVAVDALVELR